MALPEQILQKARERLAREFPELDGASTRITEQAAPGGPPHYLVVFHGHVTLPGGRRLERVVRAVVDGKGRILKWSTSR